MFNLEQSIVDASTVILDAMSPLWMEICMSTVALVGYMLVAKGRSKMYNGKVPIRSKESCASTSKRSGHPQEDSFSALCQGGRIIEALKLFAELPASSASSASARMLLTLAKELVLGEDLRKSLQQLVGKFDPAGFETAVTEAHSHGDLHICAQLLKLAELTGIPWTKRTLALIVRGHASDLASMRAVTDEIKNACSLSSDFQESLDALCAAVEAAGELEADWPRRELPMYAKAISAFGKEGHLDLAIGVFNGLRCSTSPNAIVCNCLVDACVQVGNMAVALRVFQEMKGNGLADVVSYNTVMKGHANKGEVTAARMLLEEMAAMGLTASCITYHAVLHALVQHGDRQGMWQWVENMQTAGHTANVVTCSILLKMITSPAHASDLRRILRLIDHAVEPSDEVLFGALAEACIRVGNLDLLSERTKAFALHGGLGKIYAPTYGTMIKAYGQAGNLEQVWSLWKEMVLQKVTPTAITLGCMVEALVMNRCQEDAWKLTDQVWENEDLRPLVNTVIYSTILKGFAMARQHDKVTVLNEEMKKRGIPKNKITYNTILNSMALCGLMRRVPEVLQDMREAEPRVDPDVVTYSTIIKGYCKAGDLDKSLELFQQMRLEGGLEPDELMYNSLLDGCTRQNRLEDASRILQQMLKAKIRPSNYTLSIVARFLGRARKLDQAFATVESISTEYGFRPNVQVYTCLMQACFDNHQAAKALTLHDQIVRQGIVPDEKMYTALVRGCLHASETEKAAMVVRCAYHLPCQGMHPTKGEPQSVEARWVAEVVAKLGRTNPAAASELEKQLQTRTGFHGGRGRTAQRS